jgi:outer membrane lipoprotein-sorting protein
MYSVRCVLKSLLLAALFCLAVAWVLSSGARPATATRSSESNESRVDAEALLKRSDTFRNGWPSYVAHVKITNFESGKADEEALYQVSQKGTDKTYVEFLSPRDKGRHLVMLSDDMWIYLPDTSRPVRITPLERLSGDASNGDIARTNYAVDYTPVYLRNEKVDEENCRVLELSAKRKGATYQRIEYWLRSEDARPVKAEFYLTSGKHIKSATFDEYVQINGKSQLHRLTLYDQIRHNSHSVLEYSGVAPHEFPDKLFYQGRTDRF